LGVRVRVVVGLGLWVDLDLWGAMVMTPTHAKGQGQRSFGSKVTVETDGWRRYLTCKRGQ